MSLSDSDISGNSILCFKSSTDPSELCNGTSLPSIIKADLTDPSFQQYNPPKIFTVRKSEPDTNDKEEKKKSPLKHLEV